MVRHDLLPDRVAMRLGPEGDERRDAKLRRLLAEVMLNNASLKDLTQKK